MLCATDWRVQGSVKSQDRFEELRELCTAAGDKASLAIGMTGQVIDRALHRAYREAFAAGIGSLGSARAVGDPTLTMGLSVPAFAIWFSAGESTSCCGGRKP